MKRPRWEVANVIAKFKDRFFQKHRLPTHHLRVFQALEQCRTSVLGGHKEACDLCDYTRFAYNSCRNRHCPKCQGLARERWILKREADLLPVRYFHVVFTLPSEVNGLCMVNPQLMYDLLFHAAWQTVEGFGKNPNFLGGKMGMTALLHTWGQNLSLHPHLHCIVPGGGLSEQQKWRPTRSKGKYLFPVKEMSKVFRAKFLTGLKEAYAAGEIRSVSKICEFEDPLDFQQLIDQCFAKRWVVYARRPFGGPKQVLEYLGRYSHRIAISNHRLHKIDQDRVTFSWKNYRKGGKREQMSLKGEEFLRRFVQHILPRGYFKVRHYGLLASRNKATLLEICRQQLGATKPKLPDLSDWQQVVFAAWGVDPGKCPDCQNGYVHPEGHLPRERAPPLLAFALSGQLELPF